MTSYLKKYSQRDFKDQEKIFNLFRILSFFKNKKSFIETLDYKSRLEYVRDRSKLYLRKLYSIGKWKQLNFFDQHKQRLSLEV